MIVGVDFSTLYIDFVKREPGATEGLWLRSSLRHVPPSSQIAERDAILAREVPKIVPAAEWWDGVWLAGIEYTFVRDFGSGMKTILGALMAVIPPDVHVIPMPSGLWTAWFLRRDLSDPLPKLPRKGVERKPLIKARALELLGAEDDIFPQDAYDAFGISWAVELYNRPAAAAA